MARRCRATTTWRIDLAPENWPVLTAAFLIASQFGHGVWEVAQLPLLTLWHEAPASQVAFATVHCLGGDLAIAGSLLTAGLALAGRGWPGQRAFPVGACVVAFGLACTSWSEYSDATVRRTWTNAGAMPLVPGT